MMRKSLLAAAALGAAAVFAGAPFKLGVAGYTFNRKSLDESLATMKACDCHYLCIKDFHLRYDATDAEIAAFKAKLAAAGVEAVAAGPLYFDNERDARRLFDFARRYGLRTVVGIPYERADPAAKDDWKNRKESDAMLDVVERLVKEYDVRFAIHNHGPDQDRLFPSAESAMARIAGRDPRIGLCLDVGHELRFGLDPVAAVRKFGDRIFDVHMKNIADPKKGGGAMPGPRGVLDIPGIMQALADVGYDGVCHIEYERDFDDNLAGLLESVGYYRGCMDSVRVRARMEPPPASANTLTDAERAEGWELLWDGRTSAGWVGVKGGCKSFPERGWVMEGGVLAMRPVNGITPDGKWFPLPPEDQKLGGGGDIVTERKFRDFMLKFDFRLTDSANSGVKYFYDENLNRGTCEEYQVLENGHPDSSKGRDGNRKTASLYDVYPAHADAYLKGPGKWNTGMIVSRGPYVEHWLNGVKVLEYERGSAGFKAAVKASKYADWGDGHDWGEIPEGRILIQDHSDSTVGFCNIKVKQL